MKSRPLRTLMVGVADRVPSGGVVKGRKVAGYLRPGEYREIDPVGGQGTRRDTEVALFIPTHQADHDEEGAYFEVSEFSLRQFQQKVVGHGEVESDCGAR